MHLGTPSSVTPALLAFVQELVGSSAQPVYIPISPTADAKALDCFVNASAHAARTGGQVVYGWKVWEWSQVLLEAQFHAVVQMPDGSLLDVSPPEDGATQALFVPDPSRSYQGEMVKSCHRALAASDWVDRYIHACAKFNTLCASLFDENGPEGAGVYANNPQDEIRLGELQRKVDQAHQRLKQFADKMPTKLPALEEPCPCRSGLRVMRCHGQRPHSTARSETA